MKAALYVFATGMTGIVLLLGFFSTFTAASGLPALLPLFTGFNGAVGGWNLVTRSKAGPARRPSRWLTLLLATLFTLGGGLTLRLFNKRIFAPEWREMLTGSLVLSLLAALAGFACGYWVARRSAELNNREKGQDQ